MRILATQFSLSMRSFDIYISGCKAPHCPGCHNPEGWDFNQGDEYTHLYAEKIYDKMKGFYSLIENIMIFGGEPLDSPTDELVDMITFINVATDGKPVWLFTRYDIEDVPEKIKLVCDYIKCGRYEEDKKIENYKQYGITLATSNQKIYKKGVDFT
jgi:anaerobic ribonucleoside-triphosphate reductase activating protein